MSSTISENLKKRLSAAFILIAIFLLFLFASAFFDIAKWGLLLLAYVALCFSAYEYASTCSKQFKEQPRGGIYLAILIFVPTCLFVVLSGLNFCNYQLLVKTGLSMLTGLFLFACGAALAFSFHLGRLDLKLAEAKLIDLLAGLILIALGGGSLLILTLYGDSYKTLFWFVLVVCLNDTGAYFVGRRFGGLKLAPIISPNKTVSGAIGGVVTGCLGGLLSYALLPGALSLLSIFILSLLIVILAQLGDLLKSLIKRRYGVKDMGSIIPGHGGVMDRIDGILLAAPFFLTFIIIFS